MSWHLGTLCGFDLETTGVDAENDRIVTASIVRVDGAGQRPPAAQSWLINPGIEIPKQTSDIHGITTEKARAEGQDPESALTEIADMLRRALAAGIPIVGYNVGGFDLTFFDRECRRHWVDPIDPHFVIDGQVLDKVVVPRRAGKGARRLVNVARSYGVPLVDAHTASADALAAVGVACRIGRRYPQVGDLSLPDLHALQIREYAAQQKNFADYLRSIAADQQDPAEKEALHTRADAIHLNWPLIPR